MQTQCGVLSKKPGQLDRPNNFPELEIVSLTKFGSNKRPQLSPDNKKLLWISGQNSSHESFQAYMMDLDTQKSRRLTYQDGDVYGVYMNRKNNGLIYASTTDEIKEDSDYIRRALDPKAVATSEEDRKNFISSTLINILPRTEIYKSSLDGYNIERITEHPGFDGMISVHPKKDSVYYVESNGNELSIKFTSLSGKAKTQSLRANAFQPQLSHDGNSLAWLEKNNDVTKIYVGSANAQKAEPVYSSTTGIYDLFWMHNNKELFFSMLLSADSTNIEIFRYQIAARCLQRITYNKARDLAPVLSLDDKNMYFESDREGSSQIYKISLEKLPPCTADLKKLE